MDLSIDCFGGLRVRAQAHREAVGCSVAEWSEPPLLYRKSRALTVYLAVTGSAWSRRSLASLLWSDLDESRGLANLRVVLADVKKHLAGVVVTSGRSVWLAPARLTMFDCRDLDSAWSALDAGGRVENLRSALDRYRGPFLDGFEVDGAEVFDEWTTTMRDHFERRVAILRHAANRAASLQHGSASDQERGRASAANRAASLQHGSASDQERGRASAANRAPVTERGQVRGPAGACKLRGRPTTARRTARRTTIRMPIPQLSIVGRAQESSRLDTLLNSPSVLLVTVTGPGGVGKTRLACEALLRAASGVFVDLSGITEASEIPDTIAASLGIPLAGLRDPLDEVCAYLEGGNGGLMVLDNMEQLLPGATAPISGLAGRGWKLLVTSRRALALRAEHLFPLGPLAVPEIGDSPEEIATNPSVLLVCQRAGLDPLDSDLPALAELCRREEGMPLALELAASQAASGKALSEASPTRPARHHSVAESIAWSYRLLDDGEGRLLRHLATFRGGAPLGVVRRCLVPTIAPESAIESLVAASLAERRDERTGARLAILDSTRSFAASQLESLGESDGAARLHLSGFSDFAARADRGLRGPDQAEWILRVERDLSNLRRALESSLLEGPRSCLGLANHFGWYCLVRGRMREGVRWLTAAVESTGTDPDIEEPAMGLALVRLGQLSLRIRDRELTDRFASEAAIRHAEELLERAGDRLGLLEAAFLRGNLPQHSEAPDGTSVRESLARLMTAEAELSHPTDVVELELKGRFGALIANAHYLLWQFDESLRWVARAREICESIGNRRGMAMTMAQEALVAILTGRPATVLICDAYRLAASVGDVMLQYFCLSILAGDRARTWTEQPSNALAETTALLVGAAARVSDDTGLRLTHTGAVALDNITEEPRAWLGEERWSALFNEGFGEGLAIPLPA